MSFPNSPFSSGFPFDDRDFDRDRSHSSLRSQLDDIARRHPEFAEHLNIGGGGFPFRSHTLGRHPRRGSDAEKPSGSQDAEFRRYPHDRGFSRFDHFDFPFGKYFDEDVPDFYETGYRVPERHPQQHAYANQQRPTEEPQAAQQQQQQSQPSSPQPATSSNAEKPPQIPQTREGARKQNIQQSNTVDLGQKQEPVDENRGQRSMSAPPENRSTGQRFVSSINIPIQRPCGGGGDMGAKSSTQPQEPQQQQSNKPNERVIPIHVEGRDEPILPKNVNTTFTQPPPQPQPQPQGERIFGRNPTHFTQFVNRGEPQPHGMTPEEHYRQQQQQYQKQQQNFQQQPQQQPQPQQQQQQQNQNVPQEPQVETEQPPLSSKATQLDKIQNIQKDVSELMNQVEKFNGKPRDKEYMYLDEMLTRNLLKLDSIMSEGKDNIKQARKEAIKCIEGCIGILEAKANANVAVAAQKEQEKMEGVQTTDEKPQEETQAEIIPSEKEASAVTEPIADQTQTQDQSAALEVSGIARTGSVVNVTPMEVTTAEELKKEVPVPTPSETQPEEIKEVASSTETQQKSEQGEGDAKKEDEKTDVKVEEKSESQADEIKNADSDKPEDKVEATAETTSQNPDKEEVATPSEDKKEKKKGKKKEKTDKK